jgi:GNAT superfamily N-acetyltransferase
VNLVRYADRPDLRARRYEELTQPAFPEFMFHNEPGGRYWPRLYEEHPDFQLALVAGDDLVAELHSVPIAWDGSDEDLPSGWDDAFERAFESGREPNALSAVVIAVSPSRRGGGIAGRMIEGMREAARSHGLAPLVAPVRPTLKARYPLIPIEQFVEWRRPDGAHLDPWIRTHERVGGTILRPAPESMVIEAAVSDWEEWTGLALPGDGSFVIDGMLAPLEVRAGIGRHAEPNVWLRHDV